MSESVSTNTLFVSRFRFRRGLSADSGRIGIYVGSGVDCNDDFGTAIGGGGAAAEEARVRMGKTTATSSCSLISASLVN